MPLEICKMAKHNRIKIGKNNFHTSPDKGFKKRILAKIATLTLVQLSINLFLIDQINNIKTQINRL